MKKQAKRGQSSVEFLLVTGIGLVLLTAVAMGYLTYTRASEDKMRVQQVQDIGNSIMQQANRVNSWGGNSWLPVDVTMPNNVLAIYTVDNNTLVFDVATKEGTISHPIFSTVTIVGVNQVGAKSFVNNGSVTIHEGTMHFRVTGRGTDVQIEATS